jgi:hypothetical protein
MVTINYFPSKEFRPRDAATTFILDGAEVKLEPGTNEIEDAIATKLKKDSTFKQFLEWGAVEVIEEKETKSKKQPVPPTPQPENTPIPQ